MTRSIDHIGIAVQNLESSIELFQRLLGRTPDHHETVQDQQVRTAFYRLGESSLELLQATSPSSPIASFITKRGEGVHHVCLRVDDIAAELSRLKKAGFKVVDDTPRLGANGSLVAFLHPKSTGGVLIELSQKINPPE